jgi:hypothetical protein
MKTKREDYWMKHLAILFIAAGAFFLPLHKIEARGNKPVDHSKLLAARGAMIHRGQNGVELPNAVALLRIRNSLGKMAKFLFPMDGTHPDKIDGNATASGIIALGIEQRMKKPEIPMSHTAQLYLLDTVVVFNTDTERYSYSWDGGGWPHSELTQVWRNNQWIDSTLDVYTLNATEEILTDLHEEWQNGQLTTSSYSYTYTYDANGNELTELDEDWNGTQWTNETRYTYTRDVKGNELTYLEEEWNGTQWTNFDRSTYTYNANGNRLTDLEEDWSGTQWTNYYLGTFSDSSDAKGNSILTSSWQEWHSIQWVNSFQTIEAYDPDGRFLNSLYEVWDGSEWSDYDSYTYTYDANGYMVTYSYQQWQNGQLTTSSFRYTWTYDAGGHELTLLNEHWDGGQWASSYRDTYTYDESGHWITELYEMWSQQWTNSALYSATYDANGHQLTWLYERWNNDEWTNYERDTLTYDANGNQILYLHQAWTDSSWATSIGDGSNDYSESVSSIHGYDFSYRGCRVSYVYSLTEITAVPSGKDNLPNGFSLGQNYPNPFNPMTTITYQLPKSSHVTLKVYDVLGREVATLADENKTAGAYQTTFDGSRFSSGVYFYRIQAGDFTATKKFTLMK